LAEYAEISRSETAKRHLLHSCIRHYANGGGATQNGANLLMPPKQLHSSNNSATSISNNRTKRLAPFFAIDIGEPITLFGQTIDPFKITFLTPTVLTLVAFAPTVNQAILLSYSLDRPPSYNTQFLNPVRKSEHLQVVSLKPVGRHTLGRGE
jgi:hypothetical protein